MNAKNKLPYYSFSPRRQPIVRRRRFDIKKILKIVAVVCFAVIILQFLYPYDRTLPLAHVGETNLGFVTFDEAEQTLVMTYKDWPRTVKAASNNQYAVTNSEVGLNVDAEKTVAENIAYHWWQRLIPGSFVWRVVNSNTRPALQVQNEKLQAFANKVHEQNNRAYKNASIKIEGETASIVSDIEGMDFPAEDTIKVLSNDYFLATGDLELKQKVLDPVITKRHAEPALRDAEQILSAPPKYQIGDKTGEITKTLLGTWLVFSENEPEKRLDASLNEEAIGFYLSSLYPYVYGVSSNVVQPGDNNVMVDLASANNEFNKALQQKGEQITAQIATQNLTDELRAKRDYSPSQLGLQTLINDIADEKGDYAIAVQQIGGYGWTASVNGDKKYTPASTYKLFVAYSVLKKIEAGEWTWGGRVAGASVEDCFDAMIINSDNACAEAFGNLIGWKAIENQMRDLGLKNTILNSGAFISTANDEILFMTKLARGEILNKDSRDKLIDVMKRQVYRKGIPAGTGVPVADKVGFLYGLLHDAAIVYSPSGTYALVILTNNSTWANIADAASKIQKQLD